MRDLSNKARAAITLATALALGAVTFGNMFHNDGIWELSFLVVYLLAVVGVFVVYRWWALLPALVPMAVNLYVREFTDYVAPWREETWGFSDYPFWFMALVTFAILLQVAFLAVGLLVRLLWERRRAKRRARPVSGTT